MREEYDFSNGVRGPVRARGQMRKVGDIVVIEDSYLSHISEHWVISRFTGYGEVSVYPLGMTPDTSIHFMASDREIRVLSALELLALAATE